MAFGERQTAYIANGQVLTLPAGSVVESVARGTLRSRGSWSRTDNVDLIPPFMATEQQADTLTRRGFTFTVRPMTFLAVGNCTVSYIEGAG